VSTFAKSLQSYAIHVAGMHAAIVDLSLENLLALKAECDEASYDSSWWAEWEAAQFIKPKIDSEIERRRRNAKYTVHVLSQPEPSP